MTRYRRRGTMLVQLLGMMPVLLTIGATAFMVVAGMIRFESRMGRMTSDEAKAQDLARRVQMDAEAAATVSLDAGDPPAIHLSKVSYQVKGRQVLRIEEQPQQAALRYSWDFEKTDTRFTIEKVGSTTQLVWMTFTSPTLVHQGPDILRAWSCAASVRTGGAS